MADGIVTLSDATFDETIGGADTPGPRRLLGRVVRSVQDDRPGARGDRQASTAGKLTDRQAQRRRQPEHRAPLRRDEHPDAARVHATARCKKRLVGAKGKAQLLEDLAEFIA